MTPEDQLSQPSQQKPDQSHTPCSQETILRSVIRSFATSFAKGIALTFGIIGSIFIIMGLVNTPPQTKHTSINVLPNHNWVAKPFSLDSDTILKISINGPIGIGSGVQKDRIFDILADLHTLDLKPGCLKGIILSINSPGGTSDDSGAIFRMIQETKQKMNIPVYAYVDGECCSGGMLIALAADKIIASDQSYIGSVGTRMGTAFNYSSTMGRLGIDAKTIYAGKGKDELNAFRPWRPDEGAEYQDLINKHYLWFASLVAKHRPKLTLDTLKEKGAAIFLSQEALELGYIDEINDSWMDSLESISQEMGCGSNYQLIELTPTFSLADLFLSDSNVMRTGRIEHSVRIPGVTYSGALHPEAEGKVLYYRE